MIILFKLLSLKTCNLCLVKETVMLVSQSWLSDIKNLFCIPRKRCTMQALSRRFSLGRRPICVERAWLLLGKVIVMLLLLAGHMLVHWELIYA